jgi:hypothetical protein
MKVLLDECLPKKLKWELTGHKVITVPEQGWAGKKNGELRVSIQIITLSIFNRTYHTSRRISLRRWVL